MNFLSCYRKIEDLQDDIIKNHPDAMKKELFELNIKELGKAFIEFRYSYEKDSMAFSGKFLAELFAELNDCTKPIDYLANDKT